MTKLTEKKRLEKKSNRKFESLLDPWECMKPEHDTGIDYYIHPYRDGNKLDQCVFLVQLKSTNSEIKEKKISIDIKHVKQWREMQHFVMLARYYNNEDSFYFTWIHKTEIKDQNSQTIYLPHKLDDSNKETVKRQILLELTGKDRTGILHYTESITKITQDNILRDFPQIYFGDFRIITTKRDLLREGGWKEEREKQDQTLSALMDNDTIPKRFCIFSIHRIPLVIDLGYKIGDAIPVDVYHNNRIKDSWRWMPSPDKNGNWFSVDFQKINKGNGNENLVLMIEISNTISLEDIATVLPEYGGLIRVFVAEPSVLWLKYKEQLKEFEQIIYCILAEISRKNKNIKKIHIFYAGPTPPAYYIGRAKNNSMDVEFCLYNYDVNGNPNYRYVFSI